MTMDDPSGTEGRPQGEVTTPGNDSTVVVYTATAAAVSSLRNALRSYTISHQWHTWTDVNVQTLRAVPLVVLLPELMPHDLEALLRFRQQYPSHPVVLVTAKDAEVVRTLAPIAIDEIVWHGDIEQQLAAAVRRAWDGTFFEQLARDILASTDFDPSFCSGLARAVIHRTPLRRVEQLASIIGCDRTTIWRHRRQAPDAAGKVRVEDLIGWIILMRAAQRRGAEGAWHFAAAAVGVHPRRLGRLARRLAHLSLSEIEYVGFNALARQCREAFLGGPSRRSIARN
jgi:hypothetical protein